MINQKKKIENLQLLKSKRKFETNNSYPGLADNINRRALADTLNLVFDIFINYMENGEVDDNSYQQLISNSLIKFDIFGLDTEDREKVCGHFEEIMDAIGLESSSGTLNGWMYGFKF